MILKEISSRRSIRAFDPRPVEPNLLVNLFEAARWAPSSFNEQPWRFMIARKENAGEFEKMLSCLTDKNKEWASNAAVLLICISKMVATEKNIPNNHALYDLGLAVGNLSVQATSMNLYMRQMAGFHPENAVKIYSIPEAFQPVSMIALGYQGDAGNLSEALRSRENFPRIRKPLDEIVFEEKFGDPSPLVKNIAKK
jgi:nitroreductase